MPDTFRSLFTRKRSTLFLVWLLSRNFLCGGSENSVVQCGIKR